MSEMQSYWAGGETRGKGAPERMGNWADDESATENFHAMPIERKLNNPAVMNIMKLVLSGAIIVGAGSYTLSKAAERDEAILEQMDAINNDVQKNNLMERMATEHASESAINDILADPDITRILEEVREEQPVDLVEYLKEKGYIHDDKYYENRPPDTAGGYPNETEQAPPTPN